MSAHECAIHCIVGTPEFYDDHKRPLIRSTHIAILGCASNCL